MVLESRRMSTVQVWGSKWPCSGRVSEHILAGPGKLRQLQAHTAHRWSSYYLHPSDSTSTESTGHLKTSKLPPSRYIKTAESFRCLMWRGSIFYRCATAEGQFEFRPDTWIPFPYFNSCDTDISWNLERLSSSTQWSAPVRWLWSARDSVAEDVYIVDDAAGGKAQLDACHGRGSIGVGDEVIATIIRTRKGPSRIKIMSCLCTSWAWRECE